MIEQMNDELEQGGEQEDSGFASGIRAGLANDDQSMQDEELLAAPSVPQVPFATALRGLGGGDIEGLEGIRFSRGKNSGRAIATFIDENGEPHSMYVPDSVWFAAMRARAQHRIVARKAQEQALRDQTIRENVQKLMTVSQFPASVAGLTTAISLYNPERAYALALDFAKRRALGSGGSIKEFADSLARNLADEEAQERAKRIWGPSTRLGIMGERASMLLSRPNTPASDAEEAHRVVGDLASLRAFNFNGSKHRQLLEVQKQMGMPVGFVGFAMNTSQSWNQDGGPLRRIMDLASRHDYGWRPIPPPRNAHGILPYINAMNTWIKEALGWPSFAATPVELQQFAAMLGQMDSKIAVELQAGASLFGQPQGGYSFAPPPAPANPQSLTRYDKDASPTDARLAHADMPQDRQAAVNAAKQLFAARSKPYFSDPRNPTEQELNAVGADLRRAGVTGFESFRAALLWIIDAELQAQAASQEQARDGRRREIATPVE